MREKLQFFGQSCVIIIEAGNRSGVQHGLVEDKCGLAFYSPVD
jgi:hypothetical protein